MINTISNYGFYTQSDLINNGVSIQQQNQKINDRVDINSGNLLDSINEEAVLQEVTLGLSNNPSDGISLHDGLSIDRINSLLSL
ncbi:MAG: hypothetical protein SPL03_03055 [Succinivibrio dextrinosolvens]|nr:hypothetical protein [Succinivibrio dextrinosolvens]